MKISCLGPAGSYSHLAAQKMRGSAEPLFCRDFYEVMETLAHGQSDCAILPIENSIRGGVLSSFDLLYEYEGVFEVGEIVLPIDHHLASLEGVPLSEIDCIYSHEQALGQCSLYLKEHFPSAQLLYANSTAESLSKLDRRTAGIVGSHIKKEGVVLSKENIANEKSNFTRFMLLERTGNLPEESDRIFVVAVTGHVPGALVKLLESFSRYGLNLTRIECRPIAGAFGSYKFFIEMDGNIADHAVASAIASARAVSSYFRLLGAYKTSNESK